MEPSNERPEPPEPFVDWWQVAIGLVFMVVGVGFFVVAVWTDGGRLLYLVGVANFLLGLVKLLRGGVGHTRSGD